MKQRSILGLSLLGAATVLSGPAPEHPGGPVRRAVDLVDAGRHAFRHDTFGDERFWGDGLQLHRAIAGVANGGAGPGVSPRTALGVGLKVDVEALSGRTRSRLRHGRVDLDDTAVTLALLREGAVVGIEARFDRRGGLASIGTTCALCHSTVDDSFAPGIGERVDGVPNRDLDVGTIIALAPDLSPLTNLLKLPDATVRRVLRSWGPGRFDAHLLLDGQAFRPDGKSASVLIPAASGLGGVNLATYTGWGGISHWNAFVGNLEMGGQGTLVDRRLADATKFPIAAANGFADVRSADDRVTGKLHALQMYQLALLPPVPDPGSFDGAASRRGAALFAGRAGCARCHVPPLFTEPGFNMHTAAEIGIDDFQARRGPYDMYRTTPLHGLAARQKGGFYHDGRFKDLDAVIGHYDSVHGLRLTAAERHDLREYLRSL